MKVLFSKEKYMKDCQIFFRETKSNIIELVLEEEPGAWFNRLNGREVKMLDSKKGVIIDKGHEYQININWCKIVE